MHGEYKFPKTPSDYEGPFYPVSKQNDEDNDLTQIAGKILKAEGEILNLSGIVINTSGDPLPGMIVEIWQTDPNGKYKHPKDESPGDRDSNFQYWGKAKTDNFGKYYFKTLIPGKYDPRPVHIHYKVWKNNKLYLTSQIYFKNYPKNSKVNSSNISQLQQIELTKNENGEFTGFFQIVI